MTNTAGFYKFTGNKLRCAGTSVHAPNFTLIAASHASYTYPVEGWRYFDSNEIFNGLPTVTGQTITVTGNIGITQAGDNISIATANGWTVTA